MFVHLNSTAIHVFGVNEEHKQETKLFKANGIFLNFANEPIKVYIEVYVPKENPEWLATTPFSSDDIIELAGTVTGLHNNVLKVWIILLLYDITPCSF